MGIWEGLHIVNLYCVLSFLWLKMSNLSDLGGFTLQFYCCYFFVLYCVVHKRVTEHVIVLKEVFDKQDGIF